MEPQIKTTTMYCCTRIRMATPETLTTPNSGEVVEQQEFSFIGCQSANGAATLEDSQTVSYQTRYTLTYDPAITFLDIYAKELKTCLHTTLHMDVYQNLIHNCQNSETTKLFYSKYRGQ